MKKEGYEEKIELKDGRTLFIYRDEDADPPETWRRTGISLEN